MSSKKKKSAKSQPQSTTTSRTHKDRYKSLVDIGIALSSEKELHRILDLILDQTLENTESDAASIYLTENIKIDSIGNTQRKYFQVLRFHQSANRGSGKRTFQNNVLDLDASSIAGYVALSGDSVRIDDCYTLGASVPYKFNLQVDQESGYHTKSMLCIPMTTSNGKIRGVLQIMNKLKHTSPRLKDKTSPLDVNEIIPFTDEDADLMRAIASQATVAIENAKLTEDIENLFESFIRASITAIEARDPTTSGHSDRVAVLTVEFARAIHMTNTGPYKDFNFSEQQIREVRYAALLHDFGKIGVSESVLLKQKKLYPFELDNILLRLESAKARHELKVWKEMAQELYESLEKGETEIGHRFKLQKVLRRVDQFSQQLQQVKVSIINANQPQVIAQDFDIVELMNFINKASREIGEAVLNPDEIIKLSLPKGTLSEEERDEIESHVSHTYNFLRQIAWTEDLSNVADIAHAHHEKCDGSGYPRGLTSEHIPLQSKLMTIADIYDALTAMDRPYKRATTPERAIEILGFEVKDGKIDHELLRIFVEAGIFRSAQGMRIRKAS